MFINIASAFTLTVKQSYVNKVRMSICYLNELPKLL